MSSPDDVKRSYRERVLADRVSRIASLLAGKNDVICLTDAIARAASRYWENLDPLDFCLQFFSGEAIIFGGSNRLIWRPETGFFPDPSYCSREFLANCVRLGRNPGREA